MSDKRMKQTMRPSEAKVQPTDGKAALKAKLANFLFDYVGSKVQDGITYAMMVSGKHSQDRVEELKSLCRELRAAGVNEKVFRCYEVVNGYIFDIDLGVARDITARLAKEAMDINKDLIGNGPARRRQEDIEKLAKSCKKWFNQGQEVVEVALFSRNSVPRINITGRDAKNKGKMLTYEAYAIRHWDIDAVNALLQQSGIRILKVDTHEILPSETGLRVTLHIGLA